MEDLRLSDAEVSPTCTPTTTTTTTTTPPSRRKKIQYHSQQLHPTGKPKHTNNINTNIPRNHSLEEDRFFLLSPPSPSSRHHYDDDDDSSHNFIIFSGSTSARHRHHRHEYKTRFSHEENQEKQLSSPNAATSPQHHHQPLPEFIASGGGSGNFKPPVRAAVLPDRPPSLELRPRPFRDTQSGSFLRFIACTDTQLWAGHESGLRFWNFEDMYLKGPGNASPRKGDENAAPFCESGSTSPVVCMAMDMSSRVVWSGHKDGKIRLWKMDQSLDGDDFKEGLSWRAHRGPVLSLAMSSYGDLWSGCEGGMVKVWPWETIEKSFSLKTDEKHMASLLVERSYIDLRTQVTVNGICALSHADVHFLLSDNSRAKIWSAGYQSFALWDARTRELLKVFNMDGHISRVDLQSVREPPIEDEMKAKFVSTSKKEKSQSSLSFLQRSRNALMGAADAVRRVAGKGGSGEDNHRTEALALTGDGMIWTGCSNGLLVQWDGNGNRLRDFNHHPFSVQCLCTFGTRIWVGYVNGTVLVLDLDGNLLGEWTAHNSPVIKMAVGAGYVFTLANHGGIRGWNITSPSPLDEMLRSEISSKETTYTKLENLRLLTGTWNVGQGKASHDSLIMWLASAASDVGIVVVGLQEVEMGAGFLAMSAARETVGLEGTSTGQWWLETIGKHLDEGATFERVGSRQLAGLLIALWARKDLRSHIGDVDVAAVPCGLGRAIGNKGAVGLRIRVYDRIMCFVNCHLAAHLEAVNRRNADFDHVYRTMTFNRPNLLNSTAAGSPATEMLHVTNALGIHSEDRKPELSEADLVIFLGDLNYRLHGISYEEAKDFVSQRCFDWLRERDQLRAEMKAAKVFQGMREALITFPPTYKFQRHQLGLGGYDSSEKKRIPAWCDRVLYRDNRSSALIECSLDCPVVSSVLQYEACMDVTDSDHKPVRCIFSIDIACIDESVRRQEYGWISNEKIKLHEDLYDIPETIVSTNNMFVQNKDQSILRITNTYMKDEAVFEIICEGQSTIKEDGVTYEHHRRGSYGFPRWLEVNPAAGVIRPGEIAEVSVNHEEFHTQEEFVDGIPQNWWCENTKDKVVVLILLVRGSRSTATKSHRIHLCHSFASKSLRVDSKTNHSRGFQSIAEEPDLQFFNSSFDAANSQHILNTLSIEQESKDESPKQNFRGMQSSSLQEPDLQHLNSSVAADDTQHSLHTLLMEDESKDNSPTYNVKGTQSNTRRQSDLQHLNSYVAAGDTQPILRTLPLEKVNNSSAEIRNSEEFQIAAETKHSFHTPSTDGKSINGARQSNKGDTQSKTIQKPDLQHFNSSTDSQHNWHNLSIDEDIEIGARRNNSRNLQHFSCSSQSDSVDTRPSLNTPPIEEKNRNRARGIQSKPFQQPDLQQLHSSSHAVDTGHSSHTLSMEENRPIQSKTSLQPDQQHLNRYTDVENTHLSLQTQSTRESKSKAQGNNAGQIQSMTPQQLDQQHLNRYSDATDTHPSLQTQSTREKSKSGAQVDNAIEKKSKTLQEPDSQHLNRYLDAADTRLSLQNQSAREKNKSGAHADNVGPIQSKTLQQPDQQHLNRHSDVVDTHPSLQTQSTWEKSKSKAQVNNAGHIQSKAPQQPDQQHLNRYSDATDTHPCLQTQSTREKNKSGAQVDNAIEKKSKTLQKPDSQHLNRYLDAADTLPSLQNQSAREKNKSGAHADNVGPIQSATPQQPDQQHLNRHSDVVDTHPSLQTQSTREKSKSKAQVNNAGHIQSKAPQQSDQQHLNRYSDATDTHPCLQTQSTREKNKSGAQVDNAIEKKSKTLQKPDSQHLNRYLDAADTLPSLQNQSAREKNKSGAHADNVGPIQSATPQQPDQQHLNRHSDVVDTHPSLQTQSTREKSKSKAQVNNAGHIQSKAPQQSDQQHLNRYSDATDTHPCLQTQSTREKNKSGAQVDNAIEKKSKTLQKPDSQHLNRYLDAADTLPSLQNQSAREKNKSGAHADNVGPIQSATPQQPDQQHLNRHSDVVDTHPSLQTQSTREKSKSKAQVNNAGHIQSKAPQQPDQQHLNRHSDVVDTHPSLQTQSTREKSKSKAQVNNAGHIQSKAPQQPDQQRLNQYYDAIDRPNLQTQSTQEKSNSGAHVKSAGQIQTNTPQQPNYQHLNRYSDAADTHLSLRTPSIQEKSKSGSHVNNGRERESKTVEEPDLPHLNQYSDAADTHPSLQSQSTREKSKSEAQVNNIKERESKTLQEPDSQQQHNQYSDAINIHLCLQTRSTQEKSKSEAHVNNARERESKTLRESDSQHINGFSHTESTEEKSQNKARKKNSKKMKTKSKQTDFTKPPSFL